MLDTEVPAESSNKFLKSAFLKELINSLSLSLSWISFEGKKRARVRVVNIGRNKRHEAKFQREQKGRININLPWLIQQFIQPRPFKRLRPSRATILSRVLTRTRLIRPAN